MGKRSDFERVPRDFYPTPQSAVEPLLRYLPPSFTFVEPCAGDGAMIGHLEAAGGHCLWAGDIDPKHPKVSLCDMSVFPNVPIADFVITNPPWRRDLLHPLIERASATLPTWLLFDGDWLFNRHADPFKPYCKRVVPIGRVKWIEGSKHAGKDNCAWYLFDAERGPGPVVEGRG